MSTGAVSHTGSHEAVGLVVGGSGVPISRARERVLALWTVGCEAHLLPDDRILLRFGAPRRLRAHDSPGAIVTLMASGLLTTRPLDAPTLAALDAPAGSLVTMRAGRLEIVTLDARARVDPSAWLDVTGIALAPATPLGPEPDAALALPPPSTDLRTAIGQRIPERAAEARTLAQITGRAADARSPDALPPLVVSRWAARALGWLRGLFGSLRPALPRSASAPAATSLAPHRPSLFDRIVAWLSEQLMRTRLSRTLAARHAAYVARMLDLFDRGNVQEALKWAIPLGGDGDAPPALATPAPRASLTITVGGRGPTSAITGLGDLHSLLRRRYLDVLAKLQASGMIDEAAFVLAELLRDPAGAVALLERHGRYLQAARLADAAALEPPVRIRTWMLARDVQRAIAIARRHGGMALAITMLRRTQPAVADALAAEWASHLAESGAFVEAVDMVRTIPGARGLATAWIERALEIGGVPSARMLALRASLAPERWDDNRTRARTLLEDESEDGRAARMAFSVAVAGEAPTAMTRTLARAALRAMLRDGRLSAHPDLPARLELLADDAALRADRTRLGSAAPTEKPLAERTSPTVLRVEEKDAGVIAVHDAALLPSGRLLVALGEAGVHLLARDGRVLARFDVPADDLVISDAGTRVLALARRGAITRIARIDPIARRCEPWWEALLTSFAPTFDGGAWLVGERGRATLVDVLDAGWTALARLGDEVCVATTRSSASKELGLLAVVGSSLEWWRYDAVMSRLHARRDLSKMVEGLGVTQLAADTTAWAVGRREGVEGSVLCPLVSAPPVELPIDGELLPRSLVAAGPHVALATRLSLGVRVDLRASDGRPLLHVLLDGAQRATARLSHGTLVVADDRGRVLTIDTASGAVVRSVRVQT